MADKDKDKNNPNLGCLEEDDEFEEFPVEGKKTFMVFMQVILGVGKQAFQLIWMLRCFDEVLVTIKSENK